MAVVNIYSSKYPELLREIHNPPKNLYCKGNVDLLSRRCITIVGTREASLYGYTVLNRLIQPYIRLLDTCLVSGMARGIDVGVHSRSLNLGIPTMAVIAGGIENIYPVSSGYIYQEICKNGLVVAEYGGLVDMHKGMFPMRNRILAGISDTVIVVEAGLNSGSLLTANLALEFGRDVFVVPGDINKESSQGCNMLVKQGAEVITSPHDIMDILGLSDCQFKLI